MRSLFDLIPASQMKNNQLDKLYVDQSGYVINFNEHIVRDCPIFGHATHMHAVSILVQPRIYWSRDRIPLLVPIPKVDQKLDPRIDRKARLC